MKFPIKTTIALAVIGAAGYFSWGPIAAQIEERNKPRWRTVDVETGSLLQKVNATGKVRPVKKVQIGSFVSGPIKDLYVEFNQEVKADEILARIDPRLFAAGVVRDRARLATSLADVQRVKALLQRAKNDEQRALMLRKKNKDFIAEAEIDNVRFNRMSLEAQLVIAEANIKQAEATLTQSQANLDFCEIRSPEDGMIIDRKVEPGQTLAAQFQTPELFVVGVGMREKMHIFADVDESEIGLIRDAEKNEQPVEFSVNAYPDEKFEGLIEEVRFSSAELQNVVTYPVVVGFPNPDLKLLPGMTADLSFQINKREDIVKIPKAALRFLPDDKKFVHESDHVLLDIGMAARADDDDETVAESGSEAALKPVAASKVDSDEEPNPKKKHVWVVDGELLKAVEIEIGISDNRFVELVSGEIEAGAKLVIGKKAFGEE